MAKVSSSRAIKRQSKRQIAKQKQKQLSRAPRVRVLPLTIMCCLLLLGIKVGDVIDGSQRLSNALLVRDAVAAEKPKEEKKEMAEKDNASKEAGKQDVAALEEEVDPTTVRPEEAPMLQQQFSNIELDLLQSLSERREEIEAEAEALELKQKLLESTEMRINGKIEEMNALRTQIEGMIASYQEIENKEIMSLVKIYENMKPRDAANIFNEMEMEILFEVVDKMSERKAAPVLAAMDPVKAMEVTSELADKKRLRPAIPDSMKN